jgi:hypothetical protein
MMDIERALGKKIERIATDDFDEMEKVSFFVSFFGDASLMRIGMLVGFESCYESVELLRPDCE